MAATTITRDALTDSTSPSTGDIVNAAFIGSVFYDNIDALFVASLTIARSSSGDIALTVENASNTAGSDAQIVASVAGSSAGDPFLSFLISAGANWSMGVDNSASDFFKISQGTVLGNNDFVITTGGMVLIADDANANMSIGLTINQAANDDEVLAFKSSDVAHGVTTLAETDTFGCIRKTTGASGGVELRGFLDTGLNHSAVFGRGVTVDAADTTKTIGGFGVVRVAAALASGTGVAAIGANGNLFSIDNNGTTRFIFDAEGDSHQDVGTAWTNFDDHDDLELLDALSAGVSRDADPLRQAFGSLLLKHRPTLEAARIVTFNDDGHHFINWSRAHMLTIGAVRQLGARQHLLERRLLALEAS